MKVVYLDQNKWIDVAKVFNGKTGDAGLKAAFRDIQRLSQQGDAVFPLSWVHYVETAKITNHDRRKRLGTAMWEVSGGHTLASLRKVARFEAETALAKRFLNVTPREFRLMSKGYAHALDSTFAFRFPDELRGMFPDYIDKEALEALYQMALEKASITGEGPDGSRMPSPKHNQPNEKFKEHLKTLPERIASIPPGERENFLHGIALADIQEPVYEAVRFHGLSWERDFLGLGREALADFVRDMPSRRTEIHLHRQIIKNPNLRPKDNDLEDWSGLGPATAHCDVVVCEKHFANLLRRDGFRTNARVITDIRELPDVLTDRA